MIDGLRGEVSCYDDQGNEAFSSDFTKVRVVIPEDNDVGCIDIQFNQDGYAYSIRLNAADLCHEVVTALATADE